MEWGSPDSDRLLDEIAHLGWTLMRRFSSVYARADVVAAITGLSREEFEHLRTVHYLNSTAVYDFVFQSANSFIRNMPVASALAVREDRSYPRGRIDWIRTVGLRMRQGGDPSLFVSRSPQRSRDTSPARLFAYLLGDIATAAGRALSSSVPDVVRARFADIRTSALAHLATLEARGVSRPRSARPHEYSSLRRSRRGEVLSALLLFELRHSLFQEGGEAQLRSIMSGALFAPENLDDLFEAWTLLQFVQLHLRSGWVIAAARLVGREGKRRPHFVLTRGTERVEVFYQMVPDNLSSSSAYKDLFADYDLGVSLRRPDIVANISAELFEGPLIIEVKRSRDRTYIADAAYKVLGYLGDYELHFGSAKPKAMLIVAGGIEPPSAYRATADVWIVPEARFRDLQLPY